MTSDLDRKLGTAHGASPSASSTKPGSAGAAGSSGGLSDSAETASDRLAREAASARDKVSQASETIQSQAAGLASSAASTIKDKAREGAEFGRQQAASSIGDFAAAIRKASDELGSRDQSMVAGLVREVASGLEQVSHSIEGQSVQDLTRSVAGFARRQPTAFLVGAALAGIALGRFARASSEHAQSYDQGSGVYGQGSGASGPRPGGRGPGAHSAWETEPTRATSSRYVNQPRPSEGAYPTRASEPLRSPTDAIMGSGSGSFAPGESRNPAGGNNDR